MTLKLYDYKGAPNPRRVKIFAAEKGIELTLINCDMSKREHKTPEFLQKNPSGKIPVLELEDGRCIPESVSICRYLEAIQPEPNLFGSDPFEMAWIDARNRQLELELWSQIGTSWVNGPIVGKMGLFKQIPAAKEASDANVRRYYERLNTELGEQAFIAGSRYTVADITLLSAVDFASAMVGLAPDNDLVNLKNWHERVSARPSASA
ncbi:MAG: glutathione S-transferase family protein [Pseudomonadales bacterium]|nr:glutathione S-transferase family protein [Pseudomonadales bacterium]